MRTRFSFILFPILLAYAYTVLRFQMNVEYRGATWEQLYNLTAKLPFGHRILVPLMARPFVMLLGMSIKNAYFLFEFCFSLLTFGGLYKVFQLYLNQKVSYFASVLFFFILALPYLLKYIWPVYYPYDTAAVFLMVAGLYSTLKHKWRLLLSVMAVGALNRETIIFLIPLFSLLSLDRLEIKSHVGVLAAMAAIFVVCRWIIDMELSANKADAIHFYVGKTLRVLSNLDWILKKPLDNSVQFLASVCFLPVLWLMNRKFIPNGLKRVEIWAMLFFAPLLIVGNIYEPRIFGEIIIVLYVPVMAAVFGRLDVGSVHADVLQDPNFSLVKNKRRNEILLKAIVQFDRYGFLAVCLISIVSIAVFVGMHC